MLDSEHRLWLRPAQDVFNKIHTDQTDSHCKTWQHEAQLSTKKKKEAEDFQKHLH